MLFSYCKALNKKAAVTLLWIEVIVLYVQHILLLMCVVRDIPYPSIMNETLWDCKYIYSFQQIKAIDKKVKHALGFKSLKNPSSLCKFH